MSQRALSVVASRRLVAAVLGLTVVLVVMVGAGPASASTTIGNSTPIPSGSNIGCGANGAEVVDTGYVVPAGGGVITSLSSSAFAGQFDTQVLRPNGGNSYTVVGNTGLQTQNDGAVHTYPVNIPVNGGDVLGEFFNGGGGQGCARVGGPGGVVQVYLIASDPPAGTTFNQAPVNTIPGTEVSLPVSAALVTDADLTLDQPSDVAVDATSPAGATVTYTTPAAHDEDLSTVTVSCLPASGSTFAIGGTTVTCTATDSDGDTNSPVTNTFNVHVKGAPEQLSDLATMVNGVGPGTSLADKVASVQSELTANDTGDACGTLKAFINQVKAQTGKSIKQPQATTLIMAAQQIEAVIPCTS
jgi:hypothetical protein